MNEYIYDVTRQNNESVDQTAFEPLGIYVYALQDPNTKRVFYVGKGGGIDENGRSNMRVFDHFNEAEQWIKQLKPADQLSEKLRSIINIWQRGDAVSWFVIRHNLLNDEAFHVESALIDAFPLTTNGPLDNIQGGKHANKNGLLSPSGVAAFNAPLASPTRNYPRVLVFPIQRALESNRDPYEAVRSHWSASQDVIQVGLGNPCLAVGLSNGISKIVVDIKEWSESPMANSKWEFTGTPLQTSEFLDRSFSNILAPAMGYWMRGNYIGVEFDGNGNFRIFRGSRDKTSWYPCI